ncbi:hypothetical protein N9J52_01760 [Flavobacteriales bacterium]|nr:hypothetical protein [Flavobacteriales bacterium]
MDERIRADYVSPNGIIKLEGGMDSERFFDFRYTDNGGVNKFPNAIERIQKREFDGLIINRFLSDTEIEKAKNAISNMPQDLRHEVRTGYTFPIAYFEADERSRNGGSMGDQFKQWNLDRKKMPTALGVDVESRMKRVFKDLGGGRDAIVLEKPNSGESYMPATLRVFYPNKGGIPMHCGNMFDQMLPNLYNDLNEKVATKNQLSYFIMVQPADDGGHLRVFDLEWKEGQKVMSETDVALENGTTVSSEKAGELRSFEVNLEAGDLIIFAAGEIWHRVDSPLGDQNRITIGGFLGFTKDKGDITFWS